MKTDQILDAFAALGIHLSKQDEQLNQLIESAHIYNGWFTSENIHYAIAELSRTLRKENLVKWQQTWSKNKPIKTSKNVGIIMAGNIPLVGFHDLLCVLCSGNKCSIKLSSKDDKLIPYLVDILVQYEPQLKEQVEFIDKLENIQAVIATGSNNSARYFEYYFGKYPNIIRKNRTSIAVLTGNESQEELEKFCDDIFLYFGLGCRNISKLFVPENYDFTKLLDVISETYQHINSHNKYMNNYDYNRAILLMNLTPHLDTGFLLVKEDVSLFAPTAIVHYEYYNSVKEIEQTLTEQSENIQCVITKTGILNTKTVEFGNSQKPELWDYADNVNTMEFLLDL
ncbi:MAG: acyl-CoA reductase [Bacteroidetes bacterium]|nr:acyl-CoA reductase [Bacteroidia bacterium]PCH68512.1 MAG: acyl-CoA reductase [Bacteroidota bacterium]